MRKPKTKSIDMSVGLAKNGEYFVEKVLSSVLRKNKKRFYLIKWWGWPSSYNSWEPIAHLTRSKEAIEDYWNSVNSKKKSKSDKTKPRQMTIVGKGLCRRIPSPTKRDSKNKNKRSRLPRSRPSCQAKKSRDVDPPSKNVVTPLARERSRTTRWNLRGSHENSQSSNYEYESSESSSDEEGGDILSSVLQTVNVSNVIPTGKVPEKIFGITHKLGSTAFLVQWQGEITLQLVYTEPFSTAFPDLVSNWFDSNLSNNTINAN